MAGIILKGEDFVGITDERRRAIYEAEKAAAAMGVLPDDPEKRKAIIERLSRRLAAAGKGWGFRADETVVRVDELGVARIIDKSQATGFLPGLPAHPGTRDRSSGSARPGRTTPFRKQVAFQDPGEIRPVDPREAALRFYHRIRDTMERTGYIPDSLRAELLAEGWKIGQPVTAARLEQWCREFQEQWHRKYGRNP